MRSYLARILVAIGYFSVVTQYFWMLLIVLPGLIESGILDTLFSSDQPKVPVFELPPIEMSPLVWMCIAIIMAGLLIGTVIAIVRTPKSVLHAGDLIVHGTVHKAVPVITRHQKVSKKRRLQLDHRAVLATQMLLALIPLILSLFLPEIKDVSKEVVLIVSALLAVLSVAAFTASWFITPVKTTSRTLSRASRE